MRPYEALSPDLSQSLNGEEKFGMPIMAANASFPSLTTCERLEASDTDHDVAAGERLREPPEFPMPMNPDRGTAQIIPFVPRARMIQPAARGAAASARDFAPQRWPTVSYDSGGYHEAAIQADVHDRRP